MREFLAETAVDFAVLFGSHAHGEATAESDVDIALRFPPDLSAHERFRLRNRIDAELQAFAESFVDVSDIDALPTPVAYRAVHDGIVLVGDDRAVDTYRTRIARAYEADEETRTEQRDAFIDRLARGDV
jgi:predicted nucleotidyltransferase